MEQKIINVIVRWLWLLVLATAGAGLAAYWYAAQQPVVYEASVRLIVGPGVDGLSPDLNDLRAGAQLMQTYSELATTRPILQAVIEDVGLQMSAERLRRKITVRDNGEAQILSVFVQDEDPVRSAAIANSMANVLLRLSPSGGESTAALLMNQIRNQTTTIEENIRTIEARIYQLEDDLKAATTAQEQQLYIDQLVQERARLAESRSTLAVLLESLVNTPTNQVKIVEPAIIGEPMSQSLPLLVLIGGAAGLLLAIVVVLGYEFLDNSIRSPVELEAMAGATVLGAVLLADEESYGQPDSLVVRSKPQSPTAEEYRRLATKLPVLGQENPSYAMVVSGLENRIGIRGTNEIAANLAIVLARTGMQVLLVDANLTHPTVDSQFDLPKDRGGLTDLLENRTSTPPINLVSEVPGLRVLASGPLSFDAFSDLASPRIGETFNELRNRVDVLVIAAPPVSIAASLFLASHADGVILVAERGRSSYEDVEEALSNLSAVGVQLLGTVLAGRKWATPIWLRKLARRLAAATKRAPGIVQRGLSWSRARLASAASATADGTRTLAARGRRGFAATTSRSASGLRRASSWSGDRLSKVASRSAEGARKLTGAGRRGVSWSADGVSRAASGTADRARQLNVRRRTSTILGRLGGSIRKAGSSLSVRVRSISLPSDSEQAGIAAIQEKQVDNEAPDEPPEPGSETAAEAVVDHPVEDELKPTAENEQEQETDRSVDPSADMPAEAGSGGSVKDGYQTAENGVPAVSADGEKPQTGETEDELPADAGEAEDTVEEETVDTSEGTAVTS